MTATPNFSTSMHLKEGEVELVGLFLMMGVWWMTRESNFYNDLFASNVGNSDDELLRHVIAKVTPAMNEGLLREFTDEEIKQGLDGIGDLKAPGQDGMPEFFYKKF